MIRFKKTLLKYSNWKIFLVVPAILLIGIILFLYQLTNSSLKQISDLEGTELILREKLNTTEKELVELKTQNCKLHLTPCHLLRK